MLSVLISLFGKRLGVVLSKVLPYLLGVLAVGLVGWLIWNNGYGDGVADTELKYQTAIQEERKRQIEANADALAEAQRRIQQLDELLNERDATISQLYEESRQDPDAERRAIGPDSVFRLNRVR